MLVEKINVLEFIPQKPPMVMVDGLLKNDEFHSTSTFYLLEKNIFCKEGLFTEAGLIENMAQTAALRAGYEAKQKHEKVKVGFIGAVKNLKIRHLPKIGSSIETTITITHNFGEVMLVNVEVICQGKLIAESEMSIFVQDEN